MSSSKPTHPSAIEVVRCDGDFSSYSISTTDAPAGALLVRLENPPMAFVDTNRWSSVQVSKTQNVELNCDFVFVNHGCDPSLEFHTAVVAGKPVIEIRVAARKDKKGNTIGIKKGDHLTFFYPSTEWEMSQPFDCTCGAACCLGRISGAKSLTREQLKGYFLSNHIMELLQSTQPAKKPIKESGK